MDIDVLTPFDDYYTAAINSNINLLESVNKCIDLYNSKNIKISEIDQNTHDYNCRIVKKVNRK
jgi:hypothetical protein